MVEITSWKMLQSLLLNASGAKRSYFYLLKVRLLALISPDEITSIGKRMVLLSKKQWGLRTVHALIKFS